MYGVGSPSGCARGAVLSDRALRASVRTGEDPPHADEVLIPFGISTDDVLDYALWLAPKVEQLDAVIQEANPGALEKPLVNGQFDPALPALWRSWTIWIWRWRNTLESMKGSWLARVDGWDRVRSYHQQLLVFANQARAEKVPGVLPQEAYGNVAPTPSQALASGAGAVSDLASSLGVLALGAAALYVASTWRK